MRQIIVMLTIIIASPTYSPAYAYIGPGMGGGIIAATLGVVVAIFAAFNGRTGVIIAKAQQLLHVRQIYCDQLDCSRITTTMARRFYPRSHE